MKYTDLVDNQIYKCWFRERDYWVILFKKKNIIRNQYEGKCAHSSLAHKAKKIVLGAFPRDWKFEQASIQDIELFCYKYPKYKDKLLSYEIY